MILTKTTASTMQVISLKNQKDKGSGHEVIVNKLEKGVQALLKYCKQQGKPLDQSSNLNFESSMNKNQRLSRSIDMTINMQSFAQYTQGDQTDILSYSIVDESVLKSHESSQKSQNKLTNRFASDFSVMQPLEMPDEKKVQSFIKQDAKGKPMSILKQSFTDLKRKTEHKKQNVTSKEIIKWVPNETSSQCQICETDFTVFKRKHHCRECGRLVCKECSPNKEFVSGYQDRRLRICKECYAVRDKRIQEMSKMSMFNSLKTIADFSHH